MPKLYVMFLCALCATASALTAADRVESQKKLPILKSLEKTGITGFNVRILHYGNRNYIIGGFQKDDQGNWHEFRLPNSRKSLHLYKATEISEKQLMLLDESRSAIVRLDLENKAIYYRDAFHPEEIRLYPILRMRR